MRFQKSTEYSIRCLVYMARHPDGVLSVRHLADALDMPYKFLARLLNSLGKAGIVEAQRGKHGGYSIPRPLEHITLLDIIHTTEGSDHYSRCILGFDTCDEANPCPMHAFWVEPRQHLIDMAENVTLASLAASEAPRA